MNDRISPAPTQAPVEKQRHGCLTAYLIFMIVANSATALTYLVGSESFRQNIPNMPDWALPVLIIACIFNLICAVALLRWKKWGFWGFTGSAVVVSLVNLSAGIGVGSVLSGLAGIAVLFGVLQIGQEEKGWSQLE